MKILVTGSEGFIGSHVVKRLLDLEHTVVGVDALDPQVHGGGPTRRPDSTYIEHPNYEFSMREVGFMSLYESYDAVIHLAAQVGVGQSMYEPARYTWSNSHQTAMLLEKLAVSKPKRLVVASSMSVYGEGAQEIGVVNEADSKMMVAGKHIGSVPVATPETHPPDLRSIYALTKFDQEQLSLIWGRANDVPTVALRFFNTYGPGQALTNPYTGALAIFATRILNGKAPMIYEDGQQTRDFIHVEDVAEAVVHAALSDTKVPPGIYNVGTGMPQTLENVARLLAEKLGADLPPVITGTKRAGDIRHCYADITKIKATGWAPRITFEQGIAEYANWLRTQPVPVDRFDEAAQELEKAGLVR
jgi:dTDP-L-rhamnose 4-epimerase